MTTQSQLVPNKERIALWIKALRSGEFEQWRGTLRGPDNKRCCLGIACDVFAAETNTGMWTIDLDFDIDDNTTGGILPNPVSEWFGLEFDPYLPDNIRAIHANDRLLWSFEQIADALEAKYISE